MNAEIVAEADPVRTAFQAPSEFAGQWAMALARWERSTQELLGAYRALEAQVRRLDSALEARNRELEESLRERQRLQELLSHILEGLPVGVVVWDLEDRVVWINKEARNLLEEPGYGNGSRVEPFLLKALSPSAAQAVREALGRGRTLTLEGSVPQGDRQARVLRLHAASLSRETGQKLGGLLTIEDLTEVKAMEEEVARSHRLAAMGEMAASIAHEVRNPLGSINLFASLMAQECYQEVRQGMAEQIQAAIRSVDQLLKNLLTFAKPLTPHFRPLDPEEILSQCLGFVEPLARHKEVNLVLDGCDSGLGVEADPELLKQALLNVLLNSLQAVSAGGTVRAWIKRELVEEGDGPLGVWVDINVEDDGAGIPAEVLPRVFDPFFTTRGEGSGLGLSIVHNIMKSHGGSVRIQSEPSRGTLVRLRLPSMENKGHEVR